MKGFFLFPEAKQKHRAVQSWLDCHGDGVGRLAQHWFTIARTCGDEVQEVMHDGHPTVCTGQVAFVYVSVHTQHANVGFYRGAELQDPLGLLEGNGKMMRHVKVRPGQDYDQDALTGLIHQAYKQMQEAIASRD